MALFLNSAMLTYFVEILGEKNYYGPGGFIFTESMVFFWNAIIPPFVWFIDPWTMMKDKKRAEEIKKSKENKCYLTQKEAHGLMEQADYSQGKRYADIMKTMWVLFLIVLAPRYLFLVYFFLRDSNSFWNNNVNSESGGLLLDRQIQRAEKENYKRESFHVSFY